MKVIFSSSDETGMSGAKFEFKIYSDRPVDLFLYKHKDEDEDLYDLMTDAGNQNSFCIELTQEEVDKFKRIFNGEKKVEIE